MFKVTKPNTLMPMEWADTLLLLIMFLNPQLLEVSWLLIEHWRTGDVQQE
jgi:hypothetical protein